MNVNFILFKKVKNTNVEDNKPVIIDYITKILDHYKDEESIAYWDVLNECVKDDSDGAILLQILDDIPTDEFKIYDLKIPFFEVGYNRISFQIEVSTTIEKEYKLTTTLEEEIKTTTVVANSVIESTSISYEQNYNCDYESDYE
ncbi:glycoside hydrolase family 10 protein [Piromyces sp. E2]|nr:glycoside hydrolase family 10 protein [Piromyces sp. E2]|eukprot:OUM61377.1 glycoside hydrolase family 10 protein [Piromyces sp. E2]